MVSCLSNLFVTIVGLELLGLVFGGIDDAKIVFINSTTSQQTFGLTQASEIVTNPKFDSNRKSVLYIHGYNSSLGASTTQSVMNAYITEGMYNILALDWSILAGGLYTSAVSNLNQLGPAIAVVLTNLFNIGLNSDNVHIVGHSLGAHLAGLIGRTIITISNQSIKLPRISGLDPAFPLYYPPSFGNQHINRNDATFVDIIHTDAGVFGTPKPTGTVDFWVNLGIRFQPGCPIGIFMSLSDEDLCNHQRAVLLWAESIAIPSSMFTATLIRNPSVKSHMGINCSINTSGNYIIRTNAMSPYSKT